MRLQLFKFQYPICSEGLEHIVIECSQIFVVVASLALAGEPDETLRHCAFIVGVLQKAQSAGIEFLGLDNLVGSEVRRVAVRPEWFAVLRETTVVDVLHHLGFGDYRNTDLRGTSRLVRVKPRSHQVANVIGDFRAEMRVSAALD
jgi:hypothetical protein